MPAGGAALSRRRREETTRRARRRREEAQPAASARRKDGGGAECPGGAVSDKRSRRVARSRARSSVEAYRSRGSFERQRSTTHRKGAGASGRAEPIGRGSSRTIAAIVSTAVGRRNAR